MARTRNVVASILGVLLFGASMALLGQTRTEARKLVTNPSYSRAVSTKTPWDQPWELPYNDVTVQSADGTKLRGWFIPAESRKLILVQHGYKDKLQSMLGVAKVLHDHGYQVMLMCVRAHDRSDGEIISFGQREMPDMAAWEADALKRPGVDPKQVGIFGVSMGGTLAIQFAAEHPEIRAVIADSAFSSLNDTIDTSVKFFTGLPPFPFAPLIRFWAERETGLTASRVDAKRWISKISPRPVLIMQGGADQVVSPDSGDRLYQSADQPKDMWYEKTVGHGQFLKMMPAEFERRVTEFFDKYIR